MKALRSKLEHAFSKTALLSDSPLVESTSNDEGVAEYFRGKLWNDLSAPQLRSMEFGPTIFSAEAMAYFAPAYICAYLVDPIALDSVVESFIINLGSPYDPKYPQFHRARAIKAIFSPEQLEVVCEFLRLYQETEGSCATESVSAALRLYCVTPSDA